MRSGSMRINNRLASCLYEFYACSPRFISVSSYYLGSYQSTRLKPTLKTVRLRL
jgi:hypothetical protein